MEDVSKIFEVADNSGGYGISPDASVGTSRFSVSKRFNRYASDNGILVDSFHYPSEGYKYFPEGEEGICLFKNTRMIHGSSHMFVFLIKLLHLNPEIDEVLYYSFVKFITKAENGVVANDWNEGNAQTIATEVWDRFHAGETYPPIKIKKVLFAKGMTTSERARVIGTLFSKGKKYSEDSFDQAVELLMEFDELITHNEIADNIGCSLSTVNRSLSKEAKDKIKKHNDSVRRNAKYDEVSRKVQEIINTSSNPSVTVRKLKELTSIRDYSIIKEVLNTIL